MGVVEVSFVLGRCSWLGGNDFQSVPEKVEKPLTETLLINVPQNIDLNFPISALKREAKNQLKVMRREINSPIL